MDRAPSTGVLGSGEVMLLLLVAKSLFPYCPLQILLSALCFSEIQSLVPQRENKAQKSIQFFDIFPFIWKGVSELQLITDKP